MHTFVYLHKFSTFVSRFYTQIVCIYVYMHKLPVAISYFVSSFIPLDFLKMIVF